MTPDARRTQAERRAETRAALLAAALDAFATDGYDGVGTEAIVRAAGVTRGALYHHFADKADLLAAVVAEVADNVSSTIAGSLGDLDPDDTLAVLVAGVDAWLDACAEPAVQRILLIDGPRVLGWDRWRELGMRAGAGLIEALLLDGIARGTIPDQPVTPLVHVLVGALDEAALYVARADDPVTARREVAAVLRNLAAVVVTSA